MWQSPLMKVLAIGGALLAIAYGLFGSTAVCTQCGRLRSTTEFQVPVVGIPYFWFHTQKPSPLSAVLDEHGIRRGHAHAWKFCTGSGNAVMRAIGPGRYVLGAVHEPRVAAFVRNLIDYGTRAEAEEWVRPCSTTQGRAVRATCWLNSR